MNRCVLSNSLDIKFGLCEELATRHGKRNSNESKKQASEGTPFNDDDHGKGIIGYDLRLSTWNIRTLNTDGASAELADAASPENAVDKTRMQKAGSWLAGDFDTLSQVSPR